MGGRAREYHCSHMRSPYANDPELDEGLHPEGPSAEDLDRFGDELIECAECGYRFYDQAEICPKCGAAVGARGGGVPAWALVTGVVVLAVIVVTWVLI